VARGSFQSGRKWAAGAAIFFCARLSPQSALASTTIAKRHHGSRILGPDLRGACGAEGCGA